MNSRWALSALPLALGIIACGGLPGLAPTPTSSSAPEPSPAGTPVQSPSPSDTPTLVSITVYFTDSARYAVGTPPFEGAVTRHVAPGSDLPAAVLDEFFRGPTPEEQALGLERITSGFTGYSLLRIENGIAHLYLVGPCASNGAIYTIAQPILANLLPFPEIDYVKIYDQEGTTENPEGPTNSIPACLEP